MQFPATNSGILPQVCLIRTDLSPLGGTAMKYSDRQLNEVLLAATPDQLAELRAISEVFDISMDEVCTEVLKLINAKFPVSNFVFSTN